MNYMNIYSPPTKLREDSGLSVSHSVGVGEGVGLEVPMPPSPMMHWTSLYRTPPPPPTVLTGRHSTGMLSCIFVRLNGLVKNHII